MPQPIMNPNYFNPQYRTPMYGQFMPQQEQFQPQQFMQQPQQNAVQMYGGWGICNKRGKNQRRMRPCEDFKWS